MPQVYDAPPPPKKKKKPPVLQSETSIAPEQQQAAGPTSVRRLRREATQARAATNARSIQGDVREYLIDQLVKPRDRQQILDSVNKRAQLLNPRLVAANPALATELKSA